MQDSSAIAALRWMKVPFLLRGTEDIRSKVTTQLIGLCAILSSNLIPQDVLPLPPYHATPVPLHLSAQTMSCSMDQSYCELINNITGDVGVAASNAIAQYPPSNTFGNTSPGNTPRSGWDGLSTVAQIATILGPIVAIAVFIVGFAFEIRRRRTKEARARADRDSAGPTSEMMLGSPTTRFGPGGPFTAGQRNSAPV